MSRLTRDGTAEPVSRDQILRHARGQGNIHFPCSADHEQDWQPYPVDPYSAICDDHTYIHTYIHTELKVQLYSPALHEDSRSDGAMDLVIYVARQFGMKTRSLGHFGNLRESYGGLHEVVARPT